MGLFDITFSKTSCMDVEVSGNGPPLFLVSGMFAGAWSWYRSMEALEKQFTVYRTVPALCEISGNIVDLHQCVLNTIESLNLSRVTISGASLGGIIALMTAGSNPERVNGVVICSSPGEGLINLDLPVRVRPNMEWMNLLTEKLVYDQSIITEEDLFNVARLFQNKRTLLNIARLSRASHKINVDTLLANLNCPIGAIWGSHDLVTPLQHWGRLASKYRFDINVISNTGHVPMYEEPATFVRHMQALCLSMAENDFKENDFKVAA